MNLDGMECHPRVIYYIIQFQLFTINIVPVMRMYYTDSIAEILGEPSYCNLVLIDE